MNYVKKTPNELPRAPAFATTTASITRSADSGSCQKCGRRRQVSRRVALRQLVIGAGALLLPSVLHEGAHAEDGPAKPDNSVCKNCSGSGKVPCELCSGTGFWRALGKSDARQLYKGVVCPECEGVGQLTCPVCLGTGEGSVRGLLRRRTVEPGPGRVLQSNQV